MKYRLGSLFSGIGGFELGFELTGAFETVFQVEINPKCHRILEKHWSAVPRFNDVRECDRTNLPECDVLIGGFPCQDISIAGKKQGLEGLRSGLFWEFIRLIGDLQPRVAVLENVPNLFVSGHDKRDFGRVLGGLSEVGYDAEWTVISAASQGAWHLRERVFIVAYPSGIIKRRGQQSWGVQAIHPTIGNRASVANSYGNQWDKSKHENAWTGNNESCHGRFPNWHYGTWDTPHTANPRGQSKLHRVGNGLPKRLDITLNHRLEMLGNAVVPQVSHRIAQYILNSGLLEE